MASILEICTDAADELALVRPSVLMAADDETEKRLARILTRTVRALHARYDWQVLLREKTFTTVAADVQTSAVPTDFLRFVPGTMHNRSTSWSTYALTPQEWQFQKARVASAAITTQIRRRGNNLICYPNPPAGETVAYEYVTNRLGWESDGTTELTGASAFAADTDIPFLNAELITLGVIWRYRKSEGLDYAEEFRDYELMLFDMLKQDEPRRTIAMGDTTSDRNPVRLGMPDTLTGLT